MRRFIPWFLTAVVISIAGTPISAPAQRVDEVRLRADNDNFSFWVPADERTDFEYTHGARLELDIRSLTGLQRRLFGNHAPCSRKVASQKHCLISTWSLTHQIFTPRTNSERLVRSERPYAGWLAVGVTTHKRSPNRQQSLDVELGVTGTPSLAEAAQTMVHSMGGWWMPLGWRHQLRFEPAVLVGYQTHARHAVGSGPWSAEVIGGVAANVGNLRTSLEPDVQVRTGYRARHPWLRVGSEEDGWSATLLASASGAWVLHNMFLDGTLLRDGHSVDRVPLVGAHELGLELGYGPVTAGIVVHTRSREYETEPTGHQYTSLYLSVRPHQE
jgi:hypothetical protein